MGKRTRLNTTSLRAESQKLKDFLESRLIGQSWAVDAVVIAYNRFCSPLWDASGPIIAMLSMGPSGSGKTYLAELLAEHFFGSRKGLTKIACADYAERHEIAKLLGSPTGYIGYQDQPRLSQDKLNSAARNYHLKHDPEINGMNDEATKLKRQILESENLAEAERLAKQIEIKNKKIAGALAMKIKRMQYPTGVLLFDEFEKADAAIMNFLLNVTECGSAMMANGTEVNLTKFFIVITSNVASSQIARAARGFEAIGFRTEQSVANTDQAIYRRAVAEAKKKFSTEFLNRVKTVVYRALSVREMATIVDVQIANLERLLHEADFPIQLVVSRQVRDFIMNAATDRPEYGAREISRKVVKYIMDELDKEIGAGVIEIDQQMKIVVELVDSPDGPSVVLYREDED